MCSNHNGTISSSNNKPLKVVDQFIYFGRNVLSIENYVDTHKSKAWIAIDRLLTI